MPSVRPQPRAEHRLFDELELMKLNGEFRVVYETFMVCCGRVSAVPSSSSLQGCWLRTPMHR